MMMIIIITIPKCNDVFTDDVQSKVSAFHCISRSLTYPSFNPLHKCTIHMLYHRKPINNARIQIYYYLL